MNEIQEIKTENDDKSKQESDLDNFYRGAYRRGARRKTRGNFTLFVVVALLAAIVITGIVFVIKTFMPVDTVDKTDKTKVKVEEKNNVAEEPEASGFNGIIEQYTLLNEDNLLAEDGEEFVFSDGILNHCQFDFDKDDVRELLMITSANGFMPEISVYEEDENLAYRNAYYLPSGTMTAKNENMKSEIFISEVEDKYYICIEKYCFDDFSWDIEVLEYNDGFESLEKHSFSSAEELDDELVQNLKKYGIEYTIADYSEADVLKMNGDIEENKTLLCSFDTKDGKLEADIG